MAGTARSFSPGMDATLTADEHHYATMAQSSAMMLAVLQGEMPAPVKLQWSRDAGGWGKRVGESDRRVAQLYAIERAIEGRRIGGDACPRCGARPRACNHAPVVGRLVCL